MQKEENKNSWAHHSEIFFRSPGLWAFLLPFLVYLFTAPHSVTFEDSGLFIMAGYFWGIPHPPGYPLYTMLAHLFSQLPFGTVGFKISLLSVTLGGLSSFLTYLIFNRLSQKSTLSLIASLIVAYSATLWSQMLVAEVYSLNLFLCLLFLYACLYIADHPSAKRLYGLGLVAALALANHWPIFVLCTPAYLFLIHRSWLKPKYFISFLAGAAFCILPYLLMWWRSNQNPEVSFLGEITSLRDLLHYALRKYYGASDVSPLHTWRDSFGFYREFILRLAYKDFFILLVPCFGFGVYRLYKENMQRLSWAFGYLLLASSMLLPLLVRLEFNALDENIFRVFWLVPFFSYGFFVLQGAIYFEEKKRFLGLMILSFSLCAGIFLNFDENNLHADHFAESYARVILRSVPPDSILVASTDGDVGPVAYTQMVLKENPSLKLYTGTGVFFKNIIFSPKISSLEKRYQQTVNFIHENSPVYSIKNLNIFEGRKDLPVETYFNGVTYRYSASYMEREPVSPLVLEEAKLALTHYLEFIKTSNWPYHRGVLAARLCNILVLMGDETHEVFKKSPDCQQVLARHMVATGRREAADQLFLSWFRGVKYPITREKQQYVYHFFVNRLEIVNSVRGSPERQKQLISEALPIVERTLFDYPLCDNLVYPVLNSIKDQIQLSSEALAQLSVFNKCKK